MYPQPINLFLFLVLSATVVHVVVHVSSKHSWFVAGCRFCLLLLAVLGTFSAAGDWPVIPSLLNCRMRVFLSQMIQHAMAVAGLLAVKCSTDIHQVLLFAADAVGQSQQQVLAAPAYHMSLEQPQQVVEHLPMLETPRGSYCDVSVLQCFGPRC